MSSAPNNGFLKILLHIAFFVSGITGVLIGQVLPVLSAKLALDDARAGSFFVWQFAGSLCGTLLTNWFGKTGRFVAATIAGCLLMAVGVTLINFNSYSFCAAGFLINGLGIGLTLPAINMLIVEMRPENVGSSLATLNFFWGAGAIASQPFIDYFGDATSVLLPTAAISCALLIVGSLIYFRPAEDRTPIETGETAADYLTPIWSNPLAWAIALFSFIHVGFESGMSGWLRTYTQRGEAVGAWFPPVFLYFLCFVAGRGISPVLFRFLDENKVITLSLIVILGGMLVLLFGGGIFLSIGAALAGLGTAAVYPTNLARFSRIFGESAARRATPLFLSGTFGATCVTWLIGYFSSVYGDLRFGMFVLLIAAVMLIIIQLLLIVPRKFT